MLSNYLHQYLIYMLNLDISLKNRTSYTNTGNFFSKSLILKENLEKQKTILLIVEKESDKKMYEKIFSHLWVEYKDIKTIWDYIHLENKSWGIYIMEIDDISKDIVTEKVLTNNTLRINSWDTMLQEEYIKSLTDIWYEFHEYEKPWSYKKGWDTVHIYDFDWITNYKISFWWDQVEEIYKEVSRKSSKIPALTLWGTLSLFSDSSTWNTVFSQIKENNIFTILDGVEFHLEYQSMCQELKTFSSFDIIGNKNLKIQDLEIESLHCNSLKKFKELLQNDAKEKIIITRNIKLMENFISEHDIKNIVLYEMRKSVYKSFTEKINKLVICDDILTQIFIKSRIKKKLSEDIDLLLKIRNGDFVVHIDHGIWKFVWIIEKEILWVKKEYIELRYKENAKIFVPTTEVARLSKYVWVENPKLNSLGWKSWEKKMKKVQADVQHIAEELLDTFANRKISKGYAFLHSPEEMQKFQDSFPYEYTDGQQEAVEDILQDMSSKKPMDRLLVWDVWFWKTEVAFNAIYNAYINKKQAVLISPLVVLAYEHHDKALERFADTGMKIWVLTRLEKQAEVTKTMKALAAWEIDLVVGTHKLLSDQMKFKNLWVMIVDEEHKFGVQDKEKIKNMKKTIDVLAMSATPIPRSLNMALSSIRSISILKTPPFGRKDIATHISKYDEVLIKDAGEKEFARWWQIFFIHNRVQNIDVYKKKLEKIFPWKKVWVTHGQLPWNELENRILKFKYAEFDILLSTTVIENGIDFPNVNTIFINDCQNFWVSQIHQLRGRVGRSNAKWYCYLLYKQDSLSTEAAKRLKTIVKYSYLGAGFELAMKDLEIRWGWDILGVRQSGQAREIWVSLFIKMLEEKIEWLKKNPEKRELDKIDTKIDLQISAFVPNSYFNSETDKLNFYREIESLDTIDDLRTMIQEFQDINSVFTPEVENLFMMLEAKLKAKKFSIVSIKSLGQSYQVQFKKDIPLDELKAFLKLDREVIFSVVDIQRLRTPRKHFANDKKFLEYLMKILDNKVVNKKIKIKK